MKHSVDKSDLRPPERRALKTLTTTKLAAILDVALGELGLRGFTVEVSFVPDGKIRRLNLSQRGKDKATDVLSFPMFEAKNGKVKLAAWERALPEKVLGSIVIAMGVAQRQAKEMGHTLSAEVTRLLVHGVCHLAGYDHERSPREEKLMFLREDRILAAVAKARGKDAGSRA